MARKWVSSRGSLRVLCMLATLACIATPIFAQRSGPVTPQLVEIDWPAAARDALALSPQLSADLKQVAPRLRVRAGEHLAKYAGKDGMLPIALLNGVMSDLFPGVAAIPIPVLVPFETKRFFDDKQNVRTSRRPLRANEHRSYLHGAGVAMQLIPGTTGYDALITYEPDALKALGISSTRRRLVHMAGTALSYGGAQSGEAVEDMQRDYPGLRRHPGYDEVAYTFRRYGAPYLLMVSCSNESPDPNAFKCDQAETLLRAAVRNLQLIGGAPLVVKARATSRNPPRPKRTSSDFSYYPPGKLLEGTGDDGMDGSTDANVYGDIRFPIQTPPNFGQSQVFMHRGNCLSTPDTTDHMVFLPKQPGDKHARYHCKQNTKELLHWEGHPENYAPPWRDNFCEARGGAPNSTLECPAKRGHQGQDIRARNCPGPADAESCKPDVHEVVAVAAGNACRDGNKMRLKFDTTSLYYVYLHMNTNTMDAAGMRDQHCTAVAEGKVIGKVGNFQDKRGGTTTHLHLEIHPVDLYSRFNPYMTLVRAYEQLIGAKGKELP